MRTIPRLRLFLLAAVVAGVFVVSRDRPLEAANIGAVQVVNTPLPVTFTPDPVTHTGRHASEHVRLESRELEPQGGYLIFRKPGDPADTGDDPYGYQIPVGKVLVITDIAWEAETANQTASFKLAALSLVGGQVGNSNLYRTNAVAAGDGTVFDHFSIQSGVIVRSGSYPAVHLPGEGSAILIGYFVDDL